jgi:hypothetical protein
MGKAVYKKDVSGYLDLDLESIHKEAEYNDYAAYDENWEKFENENWLNHEEIQKKWRMLSKQHLKNSVWALEKFASSLLKTWTILGTFKSIDI